MRSTGKNGPYPEILAPAGNRAAFMAAVAAGADAIYCGLKQFSARMEAKNFRSEELALLVRLAQEKNVKVYVTLNTLLKSGEVKEIAGLIDTIGRSVAPDGLIVQDPGVVAIARRIGFNGEIHLSTLANVSFPRALALIRGRLDADRVVLPRELSIDEIKAMAGACPGGLKLEVFVHGALCYGVSGRCYWSSYMGGKSGLRGRCVQPCRRNYSQGDSVKRHFSCRDLSLDVLVKVLMGIPEVAAWKIEGRKKGPHYVYYTTQAYKTLRDHGKDPKAKKAAVGLLERALGRDGSHFYFLPQRPQHPVAEKGQTGSGLLVGRVKGARTRPFVVPREALLPGDVLRVGYEDDHWHAVYHIRKHVPGGGRFFLNPESGKAPERGAPVFLTDRREKALLDRIADLENRLAQLKPKSKKTPSKPSKLPMVLPKRSNRPVPFVELDIFRKFNPGAFRGVRGFWISENLPRSIPKGRSSGLWFCLPPVIWPAAESETASIVDGLLKRGCRNFLLNAPWQTTLFERPARLNLWAGPFCNLANPVSLNAIAAMGFSGAVVSPELGEADYLKLPKQSPIPLGIVISGHWPLCISRIPPGELVPDAPFHSPKGEQAWFARVGSDYWVYPNWQLDLTGNAHLLKKAGYKMFIHLREPVPKGVKLKKRPGLWNWELNLA